MALLRLNSAVLALERSQQPPHDGEGGVGSIRRLVAHGVERLAGSVPGHERRRVESPADVALSARLVGVESGSALDCAAPLTEA